MADKRSFLERLFNIQPEKSTIRQDDKPVYTEQAPARQGSPIPGTVEHWESLGATNKKPGNVRRLGRAIGGRKISTMASKNKKKRTGGRISNDYIDSAWVAPTILAPKVQNHSWKLQELDIYLLENKSPEDVLQDLVDISPEVGRGLWDFLRMANPGWTYKVLKPGTKDEYPEAKARLEDFLNLMENKHGSFDVVLNSIYIGAWLRGAFFAEIVLDSRGRIPVDIVTPDPATVRFQVKEDKDIGKSWELGQEDEHGDFFSLDYPTVRYIPIDPLPGQPYGRPICSPAVFTSLFLLGLLYDLRRVIAQQGYPRMDIVVKIKELFDGLPPDIAEEIESDFDSYSEWVEGITAQVEAAYGNLEPDDAYIHSDSIQVNRPIGIDSSSLSAVGGLIASLERMCVRALKTMPILMGVEGGGSEGAANRQWEIHVAGIKALQHLAESLIQFLFEQGLRAQGFQAKVEWRFSELRVAELLRDEQVMEIRIRNAMAAYANGFFTQEQASIHAVGHNPATPKPRGEMQQDAMMALQGIPTTDAVNEVIQPKTPKAPAPKGGFQPAQAGGTGGPIESNKDADMKPPSLELGIE